MKKHFSKILATTVISAIGLLALLSLHPEGQAAKSWFKPEVAGSSSVEVSPPLRDLAPTVPKPGPLRVIPRPPLPSENSHETLALRPKGPDPVLQEIFGGASMPASVRNFDGVGNLDAVLPPDTQGDVGPNHYVQWVNLHFQIFDKNGNSLITPFSGNALWASAVGQDACKNSNNGDPITLYDQQADRWLMSQFALPNYPNGPFYQCIAVSTSGDPTGSYYLYQFQFDVLNDYAKFGIWPDGYYMTINQFAPGALNFVGAGVVAFERDKMLLGQNAQRVYFDLSTVNLDFASLLPADWDGTIAPPPGSPSYFVELASSNVSLNLWKFHVDWTTPANSVFGVSGQPDNTLPVAAFTSICPSTRSCIPQPGTSVGLDDIGDRLMHRLQYRNFGTHESLVSNHTVDAGSGRAGVRWYEIRDPGGSPVIFQQGTYAPADTENRWMGSIAMDQNNNMALGYSVSSSTTFPSIRYTGRLVGDPLGEMSQGEAILIAGAGSQTSSSSRWGDYSMMAVDPADDCTFWYTQEYVQTTGSANWKTRIGAFKFPACRAQHLVTASASAGGTITPAGVLAVLDGASQGFTITANPGYGLSAVNVDGTNVGAVLSYTFTNVTADHSISAVFVQQHTITSSAGTGGQITPAGTITVLDGGEQTFSIAAAQGYELMAVYVDGANVGALPSYTFTNVTADHSISAVFRKVWKIRAKARAGGKITPSGALSVLERKAKTFRITPKPGHQIAKVVVDKKNVGAVKRYKFKNVNANHRITAYFSASQ